MPPTSAYCCVAMQQAFRFDTGLMQQDMAAKGWQPADLAAAADDMVPSTLSRFLNGKHQTARIAKRIAKALGQPLKRYIVVEKQAVAS